MNQGDGVIGPIRVQWQQEGHQVVMTSSKDRVLVRRIADGADLIENIRVPHWIEMTISGGPDPDMAMRVELRDGSPVVTELSWKAGPDQGEIRQKHLRQTDIAKLAADLVASAIENELVPMGDESDIPAGVLDAETDVALRHAQATARRFAERQRLPRARRVMTDEFLQKVAQIYRENINGRPTKAVGETFNVQSRMASKYVDAARQRGYLPQTKRGQKKAWEDREDGQRQR